MMSQVLLPDHKDFKTQLATLMAEDALSLPFGNDLDIAYQKAYQPDHNFEDFSFLIVFENIPVMGLIMARSKTPTHNHQFSAFGRPIRYLQHKEACTTSLKKSEKLFRKHLNEICDHDAQAVFLFSDFLIDNRISILSDYLLNKGYESQVAFYQVINLTHDEDILWRNIRKSYHSLINWGLKNLAIQVKDANNITEQDIEDFRQLHIQEAGRETRSQESWAVQFDQVKNNEAFVVMGYKDEKLVSAALFLYTPNYCYYGVSASIREMFDKPLAHAILWTAIKHAKKTIGCTLFEMGDVLFNTSSDTPDLKKQMGISTFKRGFGGDIKTKLILDKDEQA